MEKKVFGGRIAIVLTANGIETVSFLTRDRRESLNFYELIEPDLDVLGKTITEKILRVANDKEQREFQ